MRRPIVWAAEAGPGALEVVIWKMRRYHREQGVVGAVSCRVEDVVGRMPPDVPKTGLGRWPTTPDPPQAHDDMNINP